MKIAVIGSGISGLGTALLLSQKHEVHIFEASSRLGGHAHTTQIESGDRTLNVDTGFLVYNELTYPNLKALFKYLQVETVASDMSLSVQIPEIGLEWAGDSLNTVFAQRKNFFNFKFYKLLNQILKFHSNAEANLQKARFHRWTVGQLLKNYSPILAEWYILPMVAAIWSTPEKGMLDFPAETFLTFFINHKLLQVNDRPVWRTVKNGSKNYVDKIASRLEHVHFSEPVLSVRSLYPEQRQVRIMTGRGDYTFDRVVFATHAPVTRQIYQFKSLQQAQVLQNFTTIPNKAFLHEDSNFMPNNAKCWASWNVQGRLQSQNSDKVSLTYFLNRLQPLQTSKKLLLTLNPTSEPKKIIFQADYDHPRFDWSAIDAQKEIAAIQGHDGVYFAGAWTRYGFHEDGLLSAVKVAELFEISPPWRTE